MASESELARYAADVERARNEVADAMEAYSRGGSLRKVNEANRALADAHVAFRICTGGNVPDRR
jgi:hypothetical protein